MKDKLTLTLTLPFTLIISPSRADIRLDFPHPTGPTMATNDFSGIDKFIQHYVIKFVSDLRQVGGFLWVSSTNKN
jgi:hypothetical protein